MSIIYNQTLFGEGFNHSQGKEKAFDEFYQKFGERLYNVYHNSFDFDENFIRWLINNLSLKEMKTKYQFLNQLGRNILSPIIPYLNKNEVRKLKLHKYYIMCNDFDCSTGKYGISTVCTSPLQQKKLKTKMEKILKNKIESIVEKNKRLGWTYKKVNQAFQQFISTL